MKTRLKKLIPVFGGILMLLCPFHVMADNAGFWDENSATVYFKQNEEVSNFVVKKSEQAEMSIGTVGLLKLYIFSARTWKNNDGNICGDHFKLHYKIYKSSEPSSILTSGETNKAECEKTEDNNQYWKLEDININLLSGLENNVEYVFEFYIKTTGNKGGSSGCSDSFYLSNGGGNYKIKFKTKLGLFLALSSESMNEGDTYPVTLKALPYEVSGTQYTFQYREDGATKWNDIATQTSPELVISGNKLPAKTTYYRVKYGSSTSEEMKFSVLENCEDGGTSKNIFKIDFGTLSELSGTDSRRSLSDMAQDYTYRAYPSLIDDGDYAIVSTPYFCGCGNGKSDGCDHCHTVEQDCDYNYWFRNIKDHSVGDVGTAGSYGAMLMINFSDQKSKIAYEHILTTAEKVKLKKGWKLKFSAYFASAAKESSKEPINMKLRIDYRANGSSTWVNKAEVPNAVEYDNYWKYGYAYADIEEITGDYRVAIENNGLAGKGNDALIDDISLDLCVSAFPVEFYDQTAQQSYITYTFKHYQNDEQLIRIPKREFGFGDDNCVSLISVDPSKAIGEAGRYTWLDKLSKSDSEDYYVVKKTASALLNGNVGSGKLQVVVTKGDNCSGQNLDDMKAGLADGSIKPNSDPDYVFSTNLLSYKIACNGNITASFDDAKSVCEESGKRQGDLPNIKVKFGCISNYVYYSLLEDGNAIISDKQLEPAQVTSGEFSIDLNALDQSKISRTVGDHSFTIEMYESATTTAISKICEKSSNAMKLTVVQCDEVSLTLTPDKTELCEGDKVQFTLKLKNLGDVATDVEVTEEPELSDYTYVGFEPSTESFENKVWTISNLAKGETRSLVLIYKSNSAVATGTEKVYVSKLGDTYTWGSYDRQTDESMRQSSEIKSKTQTASPTTEIYNECGVEGKKALSDLVTSDKTDLHWYSDYQLQQEIIPAQFDKNVPADGKIYYVTNQESGKCVSTAARASVTVRESPVEPVTEDYDGCVAKGTFDLSTRVTNYDTKYTYTYYSEDGSILNSPVIDITETGSNTYSVKAAMGDCESEKKDITVTVKIPVTGITLHENGKEAEEYDLSGVPTVKVALGAETDKVLTVTPSDVNYTVRWYAGDAEFDGKFPVTPYVDVVYKAVVTDDCSNTFEAKAGTQVEWPTIFMPYDNGTNQDFVTGAGIKVYVYDRSGNTVATSPDGWDGTANGKMAMPGVYYYKAELPDGSTHKGTVEVFKK